MAVVKECWLVEKRVGMSELQKVEKWELLLAVKKASRMAGCSAELTVDSTAD